MYHDDIIRNYKGMWVTHVFDEANRLVATLEWTTKKGLLEKLKKMGAR